MVRFPAPVVPLLLLTGVVAGCGREPRPGDTVEREGEPRVTMVDDDDPRMTAAINEARSTVGQFIAAVNNPTPSQSALSVKLPVSDGDQIEHMWLSEVGHANGKFTGHIANEPHQITTVKLGDRTEVAQDQISDWMYVDNGKLVGGYTLRVLRDAMSDEERRAFDESVPFTIE